MADWVCSPQETDIMIKSLNRRLRFPVKITVAKPAFNDKKRIMKRWDVTWISSLVVNQITVHSYVYALIAWRWDWLQTQ